MNSIKVQLMAPKVVIDDKKEQDKNLPHYSYDHQSQNQYCLPRNVFRKAPNDQKR